MSNTKDPLLNYAFLSGNLTRDPELKHLQGGAAVCTIGLAVDNSYKAKTGERRKETLFIDVEVWAKPAEWCAENLSKGRKVCVQGALKMDTWEDRNSGAKRSKIKMRAFRVDSLTWQDESDPDSERDDRPARQPVQEPLPDDGIPF